MLPKKPYLRHERVATLIRNELGLLITKEVEFDATLVTIVEVEVAKKLDRALIHISAIPSEKGERAVSLLNARAPYLQHLLLKRVNIKPLPKLVFILDRGLERAAALEKRILENPSQERHNS